jgi:hypothetical protein
MFALSSSFTEDELERVEDRDPFLDRGDHLGAFDNDDI